MPAYKDNKTGKWYCKFYYKNWMGENKQKWKRGFTTKKEALTYEWEFREKQKTESDILFHNLYTLYIEDVRHRLKYSTMIIKKQICETKILPYFKNKKVNEIKAIDIRRWQNELINSEKKYSQTYLKTINNQLSTIFKYARRYYNLKIDPCLQAGSIGKSKAKEMNYWTLSDYENFKEAMKEHMEAYTCFEVLYWTGMREGELLALTLEDIDFNKKTINITKTFQRLKGQDIISTPKTKKSRRCIPIPDFLCKEIKIYLDLRETKTNRIFPYTKYFLAKEMKYGCSKVDVKRIRIHDLRHSHVSLLIDQGFDAVIIAERVGHENVSTTLNTYAHMFPSKQTSLVVSLEELACSSNKKKEKKVAL